MKLLCFIALGLILLNSCADTPQESNAAIAEVQLVASDTLLPADLTYKIIKENINKSLSKCNLDIELNRKASEAELTNLANKLRYTRTNYDNLWISMTLPNMKIGSGAWATTHFTPMLEVNILGTTLSEENLSNQSADTVDGKHIGKWYEQQATAATYLYYERNKSYFMRMILIDGSSIEAKMQQQQSSKGLKLFDAEDSNGEYYIISKIGELEFYNKDNKKFATAQVVN